MPDSTLEFLLTASREPQPWTAAYNGFEFPGEVISANEWNPRWGELLVGDLFFRIVFLSAPAVDAAFELQDSRTGVCLPGTTLGMDAGPLGSEVRIFIKQKTAYDMRPRGGTDPLQSALEEAERLAQNHLLDAATQRFAAGTVTLSGGHVSGAGDIDFGPVTGYWIDILAERLLADAYPLIPIDGQSFPYPLDAPGVSLLFQAMFASHPTVDAIGILRGFGPGLELAPPDYANCPILDVIHEFMAEEGNAAWSLL